MEEEDWPKLSRRAEKSSGLLTNGGRRRSVKSKVFSISVPVNIILILKMVSYSEF